MKVVAELPHLNSGQVCHICGGGRPGELIEAFGHAMCRDRVDCYQRFKKGLTPGAKRD